MYQDSICLFHNFVPVFKIIIIISLFLLSDVSISQTTQYRQFWTELGVLKPISQKFAGELFLDYSFSNSPDKKSRFAHYIQFASILSLHYYYTAKWNFSLYGSYFSNKSVAGIGARAYPEIRFSGQAIYFFKKIGYILQLRSRLEYRLIQNSENDVDDVFRLRERIRYTKPFNKKIIRAKTYFGFISDEIILKSPSTITGSEIFDKNDITIGIGYAVTENFLIDLDYTFQYAPRPGGDQFFNVIQLNFQVNNLLHEVKENIDKKQHP